MSKPFKVVMRALVVFVFVGFIPLASFYPVRDSAREAEAKGGVTALVGTLKQYHTEYGVMPDGDQAHIIAMLLGDNPKKIVFIEGSSRGFNARGEFIDPWQTPYRLDVSNPASPRAYSFGKDKNDDGAAPGSDDIVSWR